MPNRRWVADITYVDTVSGFVYTAFQDYLDQHDIKRLRSWRAVS